MKWLTIYWTTRYLPVLYTPNRQSSWFAPFVKTHITVSALTAAVKLRSYNPNRYRACEENHLAEHEWEHKLKREKWNLKSLSLSPPSPPLTPPLFFFLYLSRQDAAVLFIISLEARTKFVRTCSSVTDSASDLTRTSLLSATEMIRDVVMIPWWDAVWVWYQMAADESRSKTRIVILRRNSEKQRWHRCTIDTYWQKWADSIRM